MKVVNSGTTLLPAKDFAPVHSVISLVREGNQKRQLGVFRHIRTRITENRILFAFLKQELDVLF